MKITLDWLGTATFRLAIDDLVLFFGAYMEAVRRELAAAAPHAHFIEAGYLTGMPLLSQRGTIAAAPASVLAWRPS
jgi:hypothetical protein